ncbi:MAG: hypothetical protein WC761_04905 [Candidatus Paceibacterota bacterium]|jgi:hypothetical protein
MKTLILSVALLSLSFATVVNAGGGIEPRATSTPGVSVGATSTTTLGTATSGPETGNVAAVFFAGIPWQAILVVAAAALVAALSLWIARKQPME